MKIFFKIILWLCMITTVVVVTPIAIENWDEWSEIGKNFIDQLMTPDEPENDLPPDADGDGLTDEEEDRIGTNKLLADTDGDGLSDGREIFMGYDPLVPNSSFTVEKVPVVDDFETEDTVTPSINVELNGSQADSLVIERDDFFEKSTLGYIGDAYNYTIEGSITSATIGFEFDETTLPKTALPTIYSYNRKNGIMRPLETTIQDGKATAEVSELATFVLLDRYIYENELKWVDVWGLDEAIRSNVEIVFVIDDSGSMTSNDGSNKRLYVAQDLIEKLPQDSKIGIVKFASSTTTYTPSLVSDKNEAKKYLSTTYFRSSGNTYMYEAINIALNLYSNDNEAMKVMVVLTDGVASSYSYQSTATNAAINAGVKVYTVGLGSSSSYFNNYLQPLSNATGGAFYYSSNASELAGIYDNIGEKIDLVTDTDGDGLSDYYEDNMVAFAGFSFTPDKNNPDSDNDGLLDGEEIRTVTILSVDGKKMTILGKVYSDPTKADSDGDGVSDRRDKAPLNEKVA